MIRKLQTGLVAAALVAAVFAAPATAQAQPPAPSAAAPAQPSPEQIKAMIAAEKKRLDDLQAGLHPQHGQVILPGAKAVLNLGEKYYFLNPADSRKVLVDGWGNPKEAADGVLGMIFPTGKTVGENDFGVVITFEKIGVVSEDVAAKPEDFDKVLAEMRQGEDEGNAERQKQGFQPIHLVGWAQNPTYDKATHNLIWARELAFGDDPEHTVNYDVRHLGRHGVLSMNFISTMSLLPQLRPAAAELASTVEFQVGDRYADKQKGDKEAGIGLAGLVGAGAGLLIAKKIGFLGILLVLLKKGAVFLLAGLAGVGAWFRKLFGLKPKAPKAAPVTDFSADEEPPAAAAETKPPPPQIVT